MKCRICGTVIEPYDAQFCQNCGTRVTATSSAGKETIAIPASATQRVEATPVESYPLQPYAPQHSSSATPRSSYGSPPAPPPYAPQHGSYQPAVLPTSSAATVSLILGIIAWTVFPLLGAIGAVVAGHIARREIRAANGYMSGDGMATAGLILGYLQIVPTVLAGCFFLMLFLVMLAAA